MFQGLKNLAKKSTENKLKLRNEFFDTPAQNILFQSNPKCQLHKFAEIELQKFDKLD